MSDNCLRGSRHSSAKLIAVLILPTRGKCHQYGNMTGIIPRDSKLTTEEKEEALESAMALCGFLNDKCGADLEFEDLKDDF